MNQSFSIYLDLVRFLAACLVYVYHSNARLLVSEILPASTYGHSAVVVFFVLSGFIISYVADTKENTFVSYAASRLSRVYSVVVPAVILTMLLDAIGRQLYPALYDYPFDQFLVRSMSSLMLLNEVWFVSITSFSNVPFWSVCYEMWYYIAFALLMFLPRRIGLFAVAGLAVLLGPKIVLLAPIWGAGVVLYRWKALRAISFACAWLLVAASLFGIVVFHHADISAVLANQLKALIGPKWHAELTFSKFFLGDYVLGLLVFLHFVGMRKVCLQLAPAMLRIAPPVRFLAASTFTLYLLHQPLFLFWGAVIQADPSGYANWWMITAMVALSVVLVGQVTERKRHILKRWIEQQFAIMARMLAGKAHAPDY